MSLLPEPQRRCRCLDPTATEPALEPVDPPRRGARGAAQVAQQVRRPAGSQHRFQQGRQGAAHRGGRDPDLRLERRRHSVGLEDGGEERAAPGWVADDDRDLLRVGPAGEQAGHLDRDRLGLPARSGGAQEDEALVERPALRLGRAEAPLEVEEERRVRVGGVGRGLLDRVDPDLLERFEQRGISGGERRVSLLVGQRHGHLGDRRERPDQVQLVARQVVEAVEEDRSPPEPVAGLQQADRLASDAVGVDRSEPVAQPRVAGEQGRDVAEVGRALEGPGRRFDVRRLEPRPLQLVEQVLQREREAGLEGGAPQRPDLRRAARSPPPRPRRGAAQG